MKKVAIALAGALLGAAGAQAEPVRAPSPPPSAPIVFFDVAGLGAARLKQFYAANFGWAIDGSNRISTPKLEGTLRQDPPETLIYLGVADINSTLKTITQSGGSIVLPRTVLPGVVTFALFKDPAGNRMGLAEIHP